MTNKNNLYYYLLICLLYIPLGFWLANKVNKEGVFFSRQFTAAINYLAVHMGATPHNLKLTSSYQDWAKGLAGSDPWEYLSVGIAITEGKGIVHPCSRCTPITYTPYTFRPPGTSLAIAATIKLFGSNSVLPYFITVLLLQFISTIFVMLTAAKFLRSSLGVLAVGLICTFCPPIIALHYSLGLFMGEPWSMLFLAIGFFALSKFWTDFKNNSLNKYSYFFAFVSAFSISIASYFRDIYGALLIFICLSFVTYSVIKRSHFKTVLLFSIIFILTLTSVQLPWKLRNYKYVRQATMCTSSQAVIWEWVWWVDYKEAQKWCDGCALGLGDYLDHQRALKVKHKFVTAKRKTAIIYSVVSIGELIIKHPIKTIRFKVLPYYHLWLGSISEPFTFIYCFIGTLTFIIFLFITKFRFYPELWSFPIFIFALSPLIHYEQRYTHPFYFLVVPITIVFIIEYLIKNKSSMDQKEESLN